jgi:RNA polymerase sigma-32 factor
VTEDEVISMNRRLSGGDASLNATISAEGDSATQWQDWLEDEDADQAEDYAERDELEARRALLAEAMDVLNERERDILTQRRCRTIAGDAGGPVEVYDVSRERIRQIEVRAFEKLQKKMRECPRRLEFRPEDHGARHQRGAAVAPLRVGDAGRCEGRALRRPRAGAAGA